MICSNCRVAADIITRGREAGFENEDMYVQEFPLDTIETLRSVASLFHGLCKGSTHCDCQHIVDWSGNKTVQR